MLAGIGTSAALPSERAAQAQQTTSGTRFNSAQHSGAAIAELRRLSGLTWDQLANLFSVSRRALHFWASGKPMTPTNEEHLQRLLSVLRTIDRGSATENRRELLAAREDSTIALDLLQERLYDAAVSLITTAGAANRISAPKLSPQAAALRVPRSPDRLVDALHDRVHQDLSAVRIAKTMRVKSDG
jgi:transcriptional regulator with XRE-family HTH domain